MPYIPTMPKNRIFPAVAILAAIPLAAWAQTPSAPAPGSPTAAGAAPAGSVEAAKAQAAAAAAQPPSEAEKEATKALDDAIAKIGKLNSVSADVAQRVDMLEQKFTIEGRYLKGPERRIYLQLKVAGLPDSTGQMLQVCDGTTLWDYQQVLESQTYGKIEIGQVFERLKSPDLDEEFRGQVTNQLGFAGPDELLRGLRKSVKFDQSVDDKLDGNDVVLLTGEWKSRDGLVGPNQQPLPPLAPLPAYVPSLVKVWIGKENGWPYKVRLVGRVPNTLFDTRKIGPDGKRIGSLNSIQTVRPTEIEIVYSNVKLNPELKADEFVFTPPQNAKVEDRTQLLVGMLDQAIQFKAAAKKAEAAKNAEDPLLKQSIDVPKLEPSPSPNALPSPKAAAPPSETAPR